jgi:predicted neutral ceramidase superfamily lipid hydrolase
MPLVRSLTAFAACRSSFLAIVSEVAWIVFLPLAVSAFGGYLSLFLFIHYSETSLALAFCHIVMVP